MRVQILGVATAGLLLAAVGAASAQTSTMPPPVEAPSAGQPAPAPATTPPVAAAPAPVAPASPPTSTPMQAPATPPAAGDVPPDPPADPPEKKVCHYEDVVGTAVRKKVCY